MFSRIKSTARCAFIFVLLCSFSFAQDDINITSPAAGDVYAGDDLSISYSYASPDSSYTSPRWAYSSSASSYQSSSQTYDASVSGSQWLNEVFNAHDETRTIYVHLLNQSTGSIIASDSRVYTYRDGTASLQSSDSNFDLIKIKSPDVAYLSGLSGNDLEIEWHYASPSGGSSSPQWSYKIDNANYSSPQSSTLVPGSAWLGGLSDGWHTLYVSLLDQGSGSQELARASHAFNYQSSGSGIQSPDSISIKYPDVSYLFASDSNGLEVNFHYQSISGGEQSLSWAYSLDGGAYSSPVSGTRHVTGPTWLSGLNYDWHELRVALLDPSNGNQLAYASHSFKYQSGSGSYQSSSGGTQNDDIQVTTTSPVQVGDSLNVNVTYASPSGSYSSPRWGYTYNANYSSPTEVWGYSEPASGWLGNLAYGQHTVYVALLDQSTGAQLDTTSFSFEYQSSGGTTQTETSGTQSPTGSYNGPTEWTFTNAGATGSYGPTQSQVNSSYSGTSLESQVTINTQGIQEWVVPVNGTYKIEVLGAAGGSYFYDTTGGSGGRGTKMVGEFSLTKDEQLKILIGQLGESIGSSSVNATSQYGGAGGGGGTFVVGSSSLLIAGGGGSGAAGGTSANPGRDGNLSTDGGAGLGRSDASGAIGGTNGNAGSMDITKAQQHDPGAGYFQSSTNNLSYGSASAGAKSFADGGAGQDEVSEDKYGSGGYGGASAGNERKGGAGGGYSGGGSISTAAAPDSYGVAGGGGSYNSGANQNNQAGANAGHGKVVITLISGVSESTNNHSNFDLIKIKTPDVAYLSGLSGNDLEIEWHYASPSGGSSSPQWSYKIDNANYSSPQSSTLVPGSAWLGGLSDGWHTLYVSLLDQGSGSQELARASHAFNYQSSGSGIQSPDSISIKYPDVSYLFASDSNGLEVNFNYQSISGGEQSLSWAYSLDGGAYSSPMSGTRHVTGPTWLSGLNYDWHELRVALLDPSNGNQLAYASHSFKYQSGSGTYQSPTGDAQASSVGTQNDVNVTSPSQNALIEKNATLSISWSYASSIGQYSTPRWAYKIDEDFYSSQAQSYEVNGTYAEGWLDALNDGNHTVFVALLDPTSGSPLAFDDVNFTLKEDPRTPPYFYFTSNDLNSLASGANLSEGNYTILKEHNSTDADTFELAPVFIDSNGYVLVEINSSVESSISFAGLETYLDTNHIQEQGFVDFMPFDFNPVDWIDLNDSAQLLGLFNGHDKVFFQEFNDTSTARVFWGLSIESESNESNGSGLFVDMAGFVYRGNFEDYWFYALELPLHQAGDFSSSPPVVWEEYEYHANEGNLSVLYANHGIIRDVSLELYSPSLEFTMAESALPGTEVVQLGFSPPLPYLLELLEVKVTDLISTSSESSLSGDLITMDENLTLMAGTSSLDYEDPELGTGTSPRRLQITVVLQPTEGVINAHMAGGFTEGMRDSIDIFVTITNIFEDFDGDEVEDHLDGDRYLIYSFDAWQVEFMTGVPERAGTYFIGAEVNASGVERRFLQPVLLDSTGRYRITNETDSLLIITDNPINRVPESTDSIYEVVSDANSTGTLRPLPQLGRFGYFNGGAFRFLTNSWDYNTPIGYVMTQVSSNSGNTHQLAAVSESIVNGVTARATWGIVHEVLPDLNEYAGELFNLLASSEDASQQMATNGSLSFFTTAELVEITGNEQLQEGNYSLVVSKGGDGSVHSASVVPVSPLSRKSNESEEFLWAGELSVSHALKTDVLTAMIQGIDSEVGADILAEVNGWESVIRENLQWVGSLSPDVQYYVEEYFVEDTLGYIAQIFYYPVKGYGAAWESYDHAFAFHLPLENPQSALLAVPVPPYLISLLEAENGKDAVIEILSAFSPSMLFDRFEALVYFLEAFISGDWDVSKLDILSRGTTPATSTLSPTISGEGVVLNGKIIEEGKSMFERLKLAQDQIPNSQVVSSIDKDGSSITQQVEEEIISSATESDFGFLLSRRLSMPATETSRFYVNPGDLGKRIKVDGIIYESTYNESGDVNSTRDDGLSVRIGFGELEPDTTYYYRCFAINGEGEGLGPIKKFTTPLGNKFWWSSATDLGGGWRSSWVGEFLPYANGWIFHFDLGWAFVNPDSQGGLWMWVDDEGWLWSAENAWPFLWASKSRNWLYPMKVNGRTYLYDYATKGFRSR